MKQVFACYSDKRLENNIIWDYIKENDHHRMVNFNKQLYILEDKEFDEHWVYRIYESNSIRMFAN